MKENLLYDVVHMLAYRDCFTEAEGFSPTTRYIASYLTKWLNRNPWFIEAFDCNVVDPFVPTVEITDMSTEKNRRFFKILKENEHPLIKVQGDYCVKDIIPTDELGSARKMNMNIKA